MAKMESIKKKLLFTILGSIIGLSVLIFVVTLSQLFLQQMSIQSNGRKEAVQLSKNMDQELGQMNEQIAKDFSNSSTKYFNNRFSTIRKHVEAIEKKTSNLYRQNQNHGSLDSNVGIIKGVKKASVEKEFGRISPIRNFIEYLPDYDVKHLEKLDLYVVTEQGLCLDGTNTPLGNQYADLRKENWYQSAKKTGKIYWSGIFTGKMTGKVKVICSIPFYDKNGKFRGCAAGDMAVEAFQQMLEDFEQKQIESLIFFDKSGNLMYATNHYDKIKEVKKYLGKKEIARHGDEIYSFAKLEETDWTVCLVLNQKLLNETSAILQKDVEDNANDIVKIVSQSIGRTMLFFIISMLIGILISIFLSNFLADGFVKPIRQLMSQVKEVGKGNLDQKIAVDSNDEIGQLADAFQSMTGELKDYMQNVQVMTADQERMTAEVNVAKQIQLNMLPTQHPAFPEYKEFDVYAELSPSSEGGGNFYDYFMIDPTHLCMVLGDVTGSGIPTTLFAVITRTHIKNYAKLGYQPDRILTETNNQLSYKNDAGLTVSVFVAILDLKTGIMNYISAGEMLPLWKRSGKEFEFLETKSCFALASMENVPYRMQSIRLSQGDMLFLHTRGVSEYEDQKGSQYTKEYLYQHLNELVKQRYELLDLISGTWEELDRFAGGCKQKKDAALMLFRYLGK